METKRLLLPVTVLLMLMASCSSSKKTTGSSPAAPAPEDRQYVQVTRDSMKSIMSRPCTDMAYEFTDLYSGLQAIPDEDALLLDDPLKAKGFSLINTGSSNWTKGPRIVNLTLETANCVCNVNKRYYTTEGVTGKYRVTETIECHRR